MGKRVWYILTFVVLLVSAYFAMVIYRGLAVIALLPLIVYIRSYNKEKKTAYMILSVVSLIIFVIGIFGVLFAFS